MPELLDQVSSCWAPTFSPPAEYLCIHCAYYGIVGGVCAFSGQSFFNRASALGISAPQSSQIQTLVLSALYHRVPHLGHTLLSIRPPSYTSPPGTKQKTSTTQQPYQPPRHHSASSLCLPQIPHKLLQGVPNSVDLCQSFNALQFGAHTDKSTFDLVAELMHYILRRPYD